MIRVLSRLEGDLHHPIRRQAWLAVFAVVISLVVVHVAHDAIHADHAGELVCVAFAVGVVVRRLVSPPARVPQDFAIDRNELLRPSPIVAPVYSVSTRASPATAPLLL